MTDSHVPLPLLDGTRAEEAFPTLTGAQVARIAARGREREIPAGEVLFDAGDDIPFYVVIEGEIEITRPDGPKESIVVRHGPGQFTGEISMLSGRRALNRARATRTTKLIELDRESLLSVVQRDSELSDILMRAFILRRTALIARGIGDVVLVGSVHSSETLRIREFLAGNGYPFSYVDLDRDPDTQALLDRFRIAPEDVPVVICRGRTALKNPTNQEIADCLKLNAAIDAVHVRDVIVVGAGPSGLAAAVYAASEGLDVLVLESSSPGGQAAASSKIENYLGFPTGVSGQELASRAYNQAEKFGAQVMIARSAARLSCGRTPYAIELEGGPSIPARAIVLATGAAYRKLAVENLARFEGAGVYYAATFLESQLCGGEEVIVVGGGNSAGQAAVFLAQTARRVHVVVRSGGLSESMSRYLIQRIEETPGIVLHLDTQIVGLEGVEGLERVDWRNSKSGAAESHEIRHVFVMTGADPNTRWLKGCVALDETGFIKTGPDLSADDLARARWPLTRSPYPLETSLPGVFAVGDVRSGSSKRVAAAVGEGSSAIFSVHRVLAE
jgi:thioredoxin reductase (NADPH)